MRKRLSLYIVSLLAAAALSAGVFSAGAVPAERLWSSGGPAYAFIDQPVSLYADASNLYVSGADKLYKFTLGGASVSFESPVGDAYIAGEPAFLLRDGGLYAVSGTAETEIATGVGGMAADRTTGNRGVLYAYKTAGGVYAYDITDGGADSERLVSPASVNALAAANGKLYVGLIKNDRVSSICEMDADGGTVELMRQARGVHKLTAGGGVLAGLFGGTVHVYSDGTWISADASDIIDISYGDGLFGLTYTGAIVRYADDLSARDELVVSASAQDGYFDTPLSVFTRKRTVAVADAGNGRVALLSDGGTTYLNGLSQPVAAAMDDYGRVYVAHATNRVDRFNADGTTESVVTLPGKRIRDLKTDSFDNVIVRTDDGVYRLAGSAYETIYAGAVQQIALLPDSDELYALQNGVVYRVRDKALEEVVAVQSDATDFAVDAARTVIVTAGGKLCLYKQTGGVYGGAIEGAVEGFISDDVRVALSAIDNGQLNYGDILIADATASCVLRIDGAALGVVMATDVQPPVLPDDSAPLPQTVGQIYKISDGAGVDMYDQPRDMSPARTLPADTNVFVIAGEVDGRPAYCYAAAEYGDGLVYGYVRKLRLKADDQLPFSPPVKETAAIQNPNAALYKYPTVRAPKVRENVPKDTAVTLLSFADAYRDMRGGRWYRIAVEGKTADGTTYSGEAYVPAANLRINNYQSTDIRPQYNAEIIEAEGQDYADVYVIKEDGSHVILDGEVLPAGTRVEVIGAFDPSEEYTHIRHFDETLGLLDCYVRTVHIEYKGVSALQIVLIVLVVLTVIAGIVLLVWRVRSKRKRLG